MTMDNKASPSDSIEQQVNELYQWLQQTHHYSAEEKQKLLHNKVQAILVQLPDWSQASSPSNLSHSSDLLSSEQRAKIYYLRGKAQEVFQEYNKDAEEALSRAVKLNPQLMDAWNVLGHCLWKKNDLIGAKNCYSTALSLCNNKISLRELSRVLRLIDPTLQISADERKHMPAMVRQQLLQKMRVENLKESVAKAKEAIKLDMSDGESWYVLANAYLSHYIAYSLNIEDLDRSLSAFKKAEMSPSTATDPDLHYNRSTILKHLERYEEAYHGFQKALELDPSLVQCTTQLQEIEQLITQSVQLIKSKGKLSQKELKATLSKFPKTINCSVQNRLQDVTLSEVEQCLSSPCLNKVLTVRVIRMLSTPTSLPLVYLVVDKNAQFCTLSIYNMHGTTIRDNDLISIPDPRMESITFDSSVFKSNKNKTTIDSSDNGSNNSDSNTLCQYHTIRVYVPLKLYVNQQRIADSSIVSPSLSIQTFSS